MIDLHIHTHFSIDSKERVARICKALRKRHINIAAFTDHLEFFPLDGAYGLYNYKEIFEEYSEYRYCTDKLLLGVETSYVEDYKHQFEEFLLANYFDFSIASIHHVGEKMISEWSINYFKKQGIEPYVNELYITIESGFFNVLGHIDYFKKYLYSIEDYPESFYDFLPDIFNKMIEKDMVLEINTSGARHFHREFYPNREILKIYRDNGGKYVTIGSDAHKFYEVGFMIKEAFELAGELGLVPVYFKDKKLNKEVV